jgi:hypothetical protein
MTMPALRLKPIIPKNLITGKEYAREIEKATQQTAALILRDFESTTRTWEHKPAFDITITREVDAYSIAAGTDDLIYLFVSEGTRPHLIRAKRSRYLVFQSGYRAKTRVGIIGSQEGGAFGDTQFAQSVQHPGTKARQFIAKIKSRRQTTLRQLTQQAIADVNKQQKE